MIMAFFEQLGKRITDAGQGMAQQTKNLAAVTKLNLVISEKEKQLSQLLLQLGTAYFQTHKNDPTAEEYSLIQQINQLKEEILHHQKEINQINGTVKCAHCGSDVPLHAEFCNACGGKVTQPLSSVIHNCPKCGAAAVPGNKFCNQCGARLIEE